MKSHTNAIQDHFQANLIAWTALHHFLPATYLRELASCIVREVSANTLLLDDLFCDDVGAGPDHLASWAIKTKKLDTKLAEYLHDRIRGLVWSSDTPILNLPTEIVPQANYSPQEIETALILGQVTPLINDEFSAALPTGTSGAALASAVEIICAEVKINRTLPIDKLQELCSSVEFPLSEFMRKHLGDLCVHSNDFDSACAFYQTAKVNIDGKRESSWQALLSCFDSSLVQSLTLVKYFQIGAREASSYIDQLLEDSDRADSGLLMINGSHDAMWLKVFSSGFRSMEDHRAAVLLPPLLLRSHNIALAMENWAKGKYRDANRQFWSILRRQIALGAIHEASTTKASFGRSLVSDLTRDIHSRFEPDSFFVAIKFLIESLNKEVLKNIDWTEDIVDNYITQEFLDRCIKFANEANGVVVPRLVSLVELLKDWALSASRQRTDIASKIMTYLSELATKFRSEFVSHINVGGDSLKALGVIGSDRPEFRDAASEAVADAIAVRLTATDHWTGYAEALKTASYFLDVWNDASLKVVVSGIEARLQRIDPAKDMWPVVRPALTVLTSDPVKRLASSDRELGTRLAQVILRFGLGQRTEFASLLYYLRDFVASGLPLANTGDIREQLDEVTEHVSQQANSLNSSNAIENINALLLAASFVKPGAVLGALDSFVRILETADKESRSISFPFAYSTLLLLARDHNLISNSIPQHAAEYNERLSRILTLVKRVWAVATNRPMVFTPFAFPEPTVPNTTLIFNWAVASLRFAKSLAIDNELLVSLRTASVSSAELSDPINRAIAMLLALEPQNLTTEEISKDSAEAFYAALGLRLASLRKLEANRHDEIVLALLAQVFRYGPRTEDLGVLALVRKAQLESNQTTTVVRTYRQALEARPELRELLKPFFEQV